MQKIIQSLEDRERKLIRQNFDIEAVYYQLKSRYIMVLNHFRFSTNSKRRKYLCKSKMCFNKLNKKCCLVLLYKNYKILIFNFLVLDSTVIKNLISEVAQPSLGRLKDSNIQSNFDSSSYLNLLTPCKNLKSKEDAETDSLGFYLNSPKNRCQTLVEMLSITKLNSMCPLSNSSLSESEENESNYFVLNLKMDLIYN